jgi:hypothetical protein
VFEHLFVDEMRDAPLMDAFAWRTMRQTQVPRSTRGSGYPRRVRLASNARERERQHLQRQQKELRGVPQAGGRKGVSFEDAAPAYETTPKGGGRESRKDDQPNTQQSTTPKQQPALNDAAEQPLRGSWFFTRGSCAKKNCQRDRIMMTDAGKARAPDSFWAKGRKGASNGQSSDSEGNAREKGGGADNRSKGEGEGKGPKIMGCRYINVGEERPRGEICR